MEGGGGERKREREREREVRESLAGPSISYVYTCVCVHWYHVEKVVNLCMSCDPLPNMKHLHY